MNITNTLSQNARSLDEMRNLLFDKEYARSTVNREVYLTQRNADNKVIDCLRYDQTVIFPQKLGREFNKTHGHEHHCAELYEVLDGEGYFLIQKRESETINEAYIVPAKKGDIIFIPNQRGHIIINTSTKDLKTANIICENYQPDYSAYQRFAGAAYYAVESGDMVEWEKNNHFKSIAELSSKSAKQTLEEADIDLPVNRTLKQLHRENFEGLSILR